MDFLYGKQRGICNGCRAHLPWHVFAFDHVVPQVKDGSDEIDNLQLLCVHCNSTKEVGTMEDLKNRLNERKEMLGMADAE